MYRDPMMFFSFTEWVLIYQRKCNSLTSYSAVEWIQNGLLLCVTIVYVVK